MKNKKQFRPRNEALERERETDENLKKCKVNNNEFKIKISKLIEFN